MKFKSDIEVQAGLRDGSDDIGTAGQLLSSTGTITNWIDQAEVIAAGATRVLIACKNTSGGTLTKGTPVYQTGNVGATDVIEVAAADALISTGYLPAIGLLETDLINNAFGNVVITGELLNITTDLIDGLTPTTGDTIYLKSGGGLTLTKPTGEGNAIQNLGLVGKVSGGNAGSLTVASIMRQNDVPNLPTGKIWVGDGNTIVSDVVYLDEVNERMGIGTTSPSYKLDVSGDAYIDETLNIETTISGTLAYGYGGVGAGNLVVGGLNFASFTPGVITLMNQDTSISAGQDLGVLQFGGKDDQTNGYANGQIICTTAVAAGTGNTGGGIFRFLLSGNTTGSSPSERMRITNTGNVGIGTTSPSTKLHVLGATSSVPALGAAPSTAQFGGFAYGTLFSTLSSGRGVIQQGRSDGAATSYDLLLNPRGGNVGIGVGTSVPAYTLDVYGTGRFTGDMYLGRYIFHNNDTNTWIGFPSNDTISFRTNGLDRVRVTSSGNVGIGTASPAKKLTIGGIGIGNTDGLKIEDPSNTAYGAHFSFDDGSTTVEIGGVTNNTLNDSISIARDATRTITIDTSERVGIGDTTPSYKLDVTGEGRFTGDLRCLTLIQTSQRDQKENINDINKSKAKAIPFKEYTYKSSIDGSSKKRYGVIAEDIENHYPELVHTGADGVKGINYIDLLVKRVAELEKELEDISLTPGPKGDTGATGAAGTNGSNGADGVDGADGNSHLSNITSIAFNSKANRLQVNIGGTVYNFAPSK